MSEPNEKRRRVEFDDALKGYYQDHDAVHAEENTDYKSLNAESVGSLILGFLSALTFVSAMFMIFPLMGIVLGVTAIRKILRAAEEHAGLRCATWGVLLSAALGIAGGSYQFYMNQFEIPVGYQPITFEELTADPRTGKIPDNILRLSPFLDEQGIERITPVIIEGYMFPTKHTTEIRTFMLVPSIQQGAFGAVTRNTSQMVEVTLEGSLRVSYRSTPVMVGGILTVNPDVPADKSPYSLRANIFR